MSRFFTDIWHLKLWLPPLLLVASSMLAGWGLELALSAAISRLLRHTSLELNDRIRKIMRGVILGISLLIGVDMATTAFPLMTSGSKAIVHKILFVLAMILAIRLTARIAETMVRFYMNHTEGLKALPNTSIFENLLRLTVYILGSLVLLQNLGFSVTPVITALGIGGLAVSLALQDTLANMFAGVNMIMARQIKIGDFVKMEGGYEGVIEDIGWRTTLIRQLNNNLIIVPNSKMASGVITNTTITLPEMSLLVEVGVSYQSDLDQVERVTVDVARTVLSDTAGAVPDFEPFIRFTGFGDSSVNFNVILRSKTHTDQYLIRHEFLKRLFARYQQEGIEIPFPQRVIHMPEGLKATHQDEAGLKTSAAPEA